MFKRLIILFTIIAFAISSPVYAVDIWDDASPAGSDSPSDIDTKVQNNLGVISRVFGDYRERSVVKYASSSTLTVGIGYVACSNASGSTRKMRYNSSATSVSWSDLDTGSEENGKYYYVYDVADSDTVVTFTVKISASSTSPSGCTYYRKVGYFYNNSSGNIVNIGNITGGNARNVVYAEGTDDVDTASTSYVDMDDMVCYFVASGERLVKISWLGNLYNNSHGYVYVALDVDGTDETKGTYYGTGDTESKEQVPVVWIGALSAGTHTVKAQWKVSTGTGYQYGATYGPRTLIIEEL